MGKLSNCCQAEVFVGGDTTKYYVCQKCKEPCDLEHYIFGKEEGS